MAHSHEGSSRARCVSSGSFNLFHTSANVGFLGDLISFQIMHAPNMATRGDRTSSQDCSTAEITSADTAHPNLPRRRVQCPHVPFASLKFADIEKQTTNLSAMKGCTTGLIAGWYRSRLGCYLRSYNLASVIYACALWSCLYPNPAIRLPEGYRLLFSKFAVFGYVSLTFIRSTCDIQ